MSEPAPRFGGVFVEVHEPLPRQGPGNRACAERALGRTKYAGDAEALGGLDQLAQEPEMHRRYSDYYAYEFFVVHRPTRGAEP